MAMQVGGVMQKNDNHAATVHLEAGAGSYGFLHVNANGERFMNEDVNTQSKSASAARNCMDGLRLQLDTGCEETG